MDSNSTRNFEFGTLENPFTTVDDVFRLMFNNPLSQKSKDLKNGARINKVTINLRQGVNHNMYISDMPWLILNSNFLI